jgi:hypothetical protein
LIEAEVGTFVSYLVVLRFAEKAMKTEIGRFSDTQIISPWLLIDTFTLILGWRAVAIYKR